MVGKTYKVLFTRLAHRRRKEIYHFELSLNGQAYARRVQKAIGEASKKLETFPQAFPNYTYHDTDFEIKYTKALDYKILFRVMKDSSEVIILSIRNDAENPEKIKTEL
jgi:plasmid stabilization system protein ParE